MKKLNSIADLKAAVKEYKPILDLRENHTDAIPDKRDILVCGGTGCTSSESLLIIEKLKEEIKKVGLEDHAMVHLTGCFGFCAMGPIVKVYPDNVFYVHVKPDDAEEIVNSHIARNEVVERLLFEEPALDYKKVQKHEDMQFYKKQLRVALRNCGHINPEDIMMLGSNYAIKEAVKNNLGISIISKFVAEPAYKNDEICILPLDDSYERYFSYILNNEDISECSEIFLNELRSFCKRFYK